MRNYRLVSFLGLALALVAAGCGDDGGPSEDAGTDRDMMDAEPGDSGFDAGEDAGMDAGGEDAGMDAGGDAGGDAGADAGMDAAMDAGMDAAMDAGMDAAMDAGTDAGPPGGGAATSTQIQAVRDAADGTVDLAIDDALVSFVKPAIASGTDGAGFFLQAEQAGPAIYVSIDPTTLTPNAEVGQVVDLTVTEVSTSNGLRYVSAIDTASWNVDSSGHSTDFLVQEVSSVDLVTELDSHESELVSLSATVESSFGFAGSGFDGADITSAGVTTVTGDFVFRLPSAVLEGSDLGEGCTVDIGPSPLWRFNATAQASAWAAGDFTVTSCPEPAEGDLAFTEIGYTFTDSDDDKEFVEIYNPSADFAFEISGCILADENGTGDADALTIPDGVIVGPGEYLVIAGDSAVSEINGDVVLPAGLGFGGSDLVELVCSGTTIDVVDWTTSGLPEMEEVSAQLDAGFATADAATDNDDTGNWCLTPEGETYGTMGRLGTPGAPNVACPCAEFAARLVINEIDYDQDGGDDAEFVELYNPTGSPIDMTDLLLVLFNGNNDTEYDRVDLTGTLAAGGYWVVAPSGSSVTADQSFPGSSIQNGSPDGVGIVDVSGGAPALVEFVTYEDSFGIAALMLEGGGTVNIPVDMDVSIGEDPADAGGDSLARIPDACDRGSPGADFALTTNVTPGAANAF